MIEMSSSSNPESSSTLTMAETAASCLMLLSKVGEVQITEKDFSCKTCGKKFANFQALGGHRASHKKPKLDLDQKQKITASSPPKPKSHKCSICNAEFALGQALGGHMRRHRDSLDVSAYAKEAIQSCDDAATPFKVLKRSNNKRVYMGLDSDLDLDLNLAPPRRDRNSEDMGVVESDLKLGLGKFDLGFVGRLHEYDLKMQFGKRRRLTLDCFV